MSITPYCSLTEFCIKQGYDDFDALTAAHKDYPIEDTLEDMLEEATQLMNIEIGNMTTSNITDTGYTKFLRNLCYRMALLMVDEELGRANEERRSQFIPRDYMFERDRSKLQYIGLMAGYREVGNVG